MSLCRPWAEIGSVGAVFHAPGDYPDGKTKTIDGGGSASLSVDLKPGTYDLYCSIPGHKEAGMDVKLTVS